LECKSIRTGELAFYRCYAPADVPLATLVSIHPEAALARWAAQLAPVVAIEAIIAWLDAGNPTQAGPP
jgi:hypothetical protein